MMTTIEERFRLCPQLRVYDRLFPVAAPYLTFTCPPGFRSDVVNTDANGFRVSQGRSGPVDSETWWQLDHRGIVLGGSFVFGVGAGETPRRWCRSSTVSAACLS